MNNKGTKYEKIGQFEKTDQPEIITGILIRDQENGQNIRVSVLEAQNLYDNGKLDQPPY